MGFWRELGKAVVMAAASALTAHVVEEAFKPPAAPAPPAPARRRPQARSKNRKRSR